MFKTPKVIEVTPLTDPIQSFDSQTNTLTLTGSTDLSQLTNGDSVYMTSASVNPSTQTSYKLTTSAIQSVATGVAKNQIDSCNATSFPERALDGDWSTSAYSSGTVSAFFTNTVIPPNHSWWQYLGQNNGEEK